LWRKTLSKSGVFCSGADANRNWGFKWMSALTNIARILPAPVPDTLTHFTFLNVGGGASRNPCAETYAGKSAFSEIETKSMSKYLKSIGEKLFAYISFHSYSQLLLFPYGHTSQHLDNYNESVSRNLHLELVALATDFCSIHVFNVQPQCFHLFF
jgi:hypothetical protein